MKTQLIGIFLSFTFLTANGQEILDSLWELNDQNFRLRLEMDEKGFPLNTRLILEREQFTIITDSIFTTRLHIERLDMNSDGYKDLLVYHGSGARANELYFLYLFDKKSLTYKKVDGFEEWPNLNKTKMEGVLASTILTGIVEYRFFTLTDSGQLVDLGISEEDLNLDGKELDKGLRRAKRKLNMK